MAADNWLRCAAPLQGDTDAYAYRINSSGVVVGVSQLGNEGADSPARTLVWNVDGSQTIVGSGQGYTTPRGINDAGTVVGTTAPSLSSPVWSGFIWSAEAGMQIVNLPGIHVSSVDAVNNQGQVVLNVDNGSSFFMYQQGGEPVSIQGTVAQPLITTALNSEGTVIGACYYPDYQIHSMAWSESTGLVDLTPFDNLDWSQAIDINDSGQIVGIEHFDGGPTTSFLYEDGQLYDLHSLMGANGADWTTLIVESINNSGQIAGYGILDGESQAFLLSPVDGIAPAVIPEPTAIGILWVGSVLMVGRRRRGRIGC